MEARGTQGYTLEGVEVAGGFSRRWRGLMARRPVPLLLRTRSVHGFWLRRPLEVVGLDEEGTVIARAVLRRRRIVYVPRARWILELPPGVAAPGMGDRLTFVPGPGEADPDAGKALPMRHSDRESR